MTDTAQPIDLDAAYAIERGNLRLQLMEASREQQEYLRTARLLIALRQNLMFSLLPLEECLTAVYGAGGSRRFWEIQLSRPMTLDAFVDRLAVAGADDESRFESHQMALRTAILEAHQMGEAWFCGDTPSLTTALYGHQVQGDAVKVIPRSAAEWLMRNPLWRHLVPSSLSVFLLPPARRTDADKPTQEEVNAWMLNFFQDARARGLPPPKRDHEAFPDCAKAIGATDRQMKAAMHVIPSNLKRARGGKDRG